MDTATNDLRDIDYARVAPLPNLNDYLEYIAELERSATERSMKNPIHAEIIPDATPAWHVLVIGPGQERAAARHLIERGFGVYLPEFDKTIISRGRKRQRTERMFPGYLFVFVWGVERQWRRMESCPGVIHPLCVGERPAVVPDRIIDHIQAAETECRLHGGVVQRGIVVEKKKKRPRRRKPQQERKDPDLPEGITLGPTQELVTISTRSYFTTAAALDGKQRNTLLHIALGLPLQTAP